MNKGTLYTYTATPNRALTMTMTRTKNELKPNDPYRRKHKKVKHN